MAQMAEYLIFILKHLVNRIAILDLHIEIITNEIAKIESKNLKFSEKKLFNNPNLNIFKKDTNLNIDLNTNPNISNVPNKVVEYTYISSDDDIEQFLSEKTIKQEQSVINNNNFNNQKNNSQDDLPEENETLTKALNKTLRDISTKPSLFFSSANPTTIQSYLNELGSNILQEVIDKKNKYLVEEYDIVNKTFKYIRSIYIEIEEEPFASEDFRKAFKSQIIKNETNNIFFESSNILVVKQYLRRRKNTEENYRQDVITIEIQNHIFINFKNI
ncbi:hypothetical protein F8M41_006141 [Gigaspora margarita]|uniref:Uncharacterized protein n=1 Tax=Gigaspora margarita TaxID=4874 RepID=A0A8H4B4M5_GIGMA|nr:hypothetical protein F8M41_006141 [Gigaspora margarita]